MRRRRFLAALPLAVGLSGCLGRSDQTGTTAGPDSAASGADAGTPVATGSPANTNTSGDTGTASATDPVTATATPNTANYTVPLTLRSSFRHVINVDGIRVVAPDRDQFAFVTPPPIDGEPAPGAFTLALGERQFSPASMPRRYRAWTPGIESVYVDEDRSGSLMFDVPAVETDTAALVYDGTRYPLPGDDHDRLDAAPDFTLESVSVPESVEPDEYIELGLTVRNEGDREGIYLAGFRTAGLPRTIEVTVAPGETGTASVAYETFEDAETMHFDFDHPGGDRDYEVEIERPTGTDTG